MKLHPQRTLGQNVSSARRLLKPIDLSSIIGNALINGSKSWWVPSATATGLSATYNRAMNGDFDGWYQTLIPLAIPLGMVLTGYTLKYLPILVGQRIKYAYDNDAHLLNAYRRSRIEPVLDELIHKVQIPESRLFYSEENQRAEEAAISRHRTIIKKNLEKLPEDTLAYLGFSKDSNLDQLVEALDLVNPLSSGIERSISGLKITLKSATRSNRSQPNIYVLVGYDVSLLSEWMQGDPLTPSEKQLSSQIQTNPLLKAAYRMATQELEKPVLEKYESGKLYDLWKGVGADATRFLAFREVMLKSGRLLDKLYKDYPHATKLNMESILRPDEDEVYMKQFPGLTERVLNDRASMIRGIFGNSYEEMVDMVNRITLHTILKATALRIRFDPEYAGSPSLPNNFIDDITAVSARDISEFKEVAHEMQQERKSYEKYAPAEINPEQRRAIAIAFHTNYHNIRSITKQESTNNDKKRQKLEFQRNEIIRNVIKDAPRFTELLVEVRTYQTLCCIDRKEYINQLNKLGQYHM